MLLSLMRTSPLFLLFSIGACLSNEAPAPGPLAPSPSQSALPPAAQPDTPAPSPEAGVSSVVPAQVPQDSDDFQIAGTWVEKWVNAGIDQLPIIGQVKSTTATYLRLEISEDVQGTARVKAQTCELIIDSGTSLVKTIVPRQLIRSLPIAERTAQISRQAGAIRYVQPEVVELRGVRLEAPATDALPTGPEDPRLVDQDRDGKPGITVRVGGMVDGEIYVVQRDFHDRRGQVLALDRIEGLTKWSREQTTLGSDNAILRTNQVRSTPDPDPALSYFAMRRIPSQITCDDIAKAPESFFE